MHIPLTQTVVEIGGSPVEIKARKEDHRWSVIAFTPNFSIRSNKLSLTGTRDAFAKAIALSIFDWEIMEEDEEPIRQALADIEQAILLVTNNFSD